MIYITGKKYTTISAAAGEIYCVTLTAAGHKIDILNNTDNNIYVSDKNDFLQLASGSAYLTIPPGGGYNGLAAASDKLYIRTVGVGTVSIAENP